MPVQAFASHNIRSLNLTKPSGRGSCARIAGVWEANKLEKKPLMKAIIEEKAWVAIGVEVLIMQFGWWVVLQARDAMDFGWFNSTWFFLDSSGIPCASKQIVSNFLLSHKLSGLLTNCSCSKLTGMQLKKWFGWSKNRVVVISDVPLRS